MKYVIIECDTAAQYGNNLFPVIAPFIFTRYGIFLKELLHSETEDGKGPADAHFGTAMRHVDTYIERNKFNVVMPLELVSAINHGDGMRGCIGEMLYMNKKSEMYWKRDVAFKTGGRLKELGTINQFTYRRSGEEHESYICEVRTYECSDPLIWWFRNYISEVVEATDAVPDTEKMDDE